MKQVDENVLSRHRTDGIHTSATISFRLEKYLREFVYGGIDGCITTFAVVAGGFGAGLNSSIIIILGFANLFADGFSMSVGAYLSSKSARDNIRKHQNNEIELLKLFPEKTKQKVHDIYKAKGFKGELLDKITDGILSDQTILLNVLLKEDMTMIEEPKSPLLISTVTFISFFMVGLIPMLVYVWDYIFPLEASLFVWSSTLTATGFILIGVLKSQVANTKKWKSILETLLLGGTAALVAYYVGDILDRLLSR